MTVEEANVALYEKMYQEQQEYAAWLKALPAEEILDHAFEYTNRENLLAAMEGNDLELQESKALLNSPAPLAEVYSAWLRTDDSSMEEMWRVIESQAREKLQALVTPDPQAYRQLKASHPDRVAGVMVGDYVMFYGADAVKAADALGTNVEKMDVPGLGRTEVTGSNLAWQDTLKKLSNKKISAVLAQKNAELGEDSPYETIKEIDFSPEAAPLTPEETAQRIYALTEKVCPELLAGRDRDAEIHALERCLGRGDTEDICGLLMDLADYSNTPEQHQEANRLLNETGRMYFDKRRDGPDLSL